MRSGKQGLTLATIVIVAVALTISALYFFVIRKPKQQNGRLSVSVRLKWLHQAQFAGFYVADAKGFYAQGGLTVSLKPGGVEFPSIQSVVSGLDKFGITGADQILLHRSQGAPIVAVATIYRATPMVLFSFAESNIRSPKDLAGKRVGVKLGGNEELTYRSILRAAKVDASAIREVPVKYDMTPLFEGFVDVWPGYLINEVLVAREQGRQVNVINPRDYGVDLYADTLFTTEAVLRKEPEVVRKFVRATLNGWQYAVDHPQEAANIVLEYDRQLHYPHELAMMQESIPLLKPDAKPIGWMDQADWERMQQLLELVS